MKRLTLEATDENVLNSIKENTYNRNSDVENFVKTLDVIEGNMFLSLDARWGEGKTFYVRQTEKALEYITKKKWTEGDNTSFENVKPYFQNTIFDKIELKKSYMPIYYNAWLYDNHDDPLMSLMFFIIKKVEIYLKTKLSKSLVEKAKTLFSAISASISWGNTQNSVSLGVDGETIVKAFDVEDIFKNIKTAEEIRELVKQILNEVIVEKAERLVIFIDELDRCKPSYAIEMLERIKHYFDDERIIFVISVNKAQLIHTIKHSYGMEFDSSGYLNRFFDMNFELPLCNMDMVMQNMGLKEYSHNIMKKIATEIQKSYKLSIRDTAVYLSKVQQVEGTNKMYGNATWSVLSILIPIICLFDIIDVDKKRMVLSGDGELLIKDVIEKSKSAKKAIGYFVTKVPEGTDIFDVAWKEFLDIYKYAFKDDQNYVWYPGSFEINRDLKNTCLRACNLV